MRPVIVAGNWKMNTLPGEAGPLARDIADATRSATGVIRVICPPFVSLAEVADALSGEEIAVGAQTVHWDQAGAYTGEVSATMVAKLATWAIVGHSERRRDQHETDELVNLKVSRAIAAGLTPILCVGEQLAQREQGHAEDVVRRQLERDLAGYGGSEAARLEESASPELRPWLTIAYEPVWAIGTGRTARGADAAQMAATIRATLAGLGWGRAAERVPILYGGSVTSATIAEFLAEPALDGALVGGASLKVEEMAGIAARAALTAAARAGAAAPA